MLVIKGKDNYKPVKQIYKVLYVYREIWYIKNHLDAWEEEVLSNLRALKIVVDNHDILAANQKKEFKIKIDKDEELGKIIDEKERADYMNNNYLFEGSVLMNLMSVQRNSALISAFSLFEGNMSRICNEFEICLNSNIKLKDLNGKGTLDNYWNFLKNVIDIDTANLESVFSQIKEYNFIRNRIVHNGNIIKDEKKAKEIEKKHQELKVYKDIYSSKFLIHDVVFLDKLINLIIKFFKDLYLELNNRISSPVNIFIDSDSKLKPIEKK